MSILQTNIDNPAQELMVAILGHIRMDTLNSFKVLVDYCEKYLEELGVRRYNSTYNYLRIHRRQPSGGQVRTVSLVSKEHKVNGQWLFDMYEFVGYFDDDSTRAYKWTSSYRRPYGNDKFSQSFFRLFIIPDDIFEILRKSI